MRITTTIVVCFMAMAAFGMILPAGAATSASIGSATSSTCDTVSITIDTDATAGIGTATLTVDYDPSKISLSSVTDGALGTVTYSDVSGTITMTATHATNCPTGSGITFAELEFCPVSGASGCSDLDLEVTTIYDCNVAPVTPVTANDGTFCITGGIGTTVSIGSATSSTCDTVSITIDTDATAGIGTATLTVDYDPSKISLSSVTDGALGTVTYSDVSGTITMTATHATNCPTGSGITFAELEFCPVSGASGCSDLDLEVTTIYDCNVAPVTPVTANDGTFCITGGIGTTVSIGSATSSTCDTVSITIDTDATAGIGTATLTVDYDPSKISLSSVTDGALGTVTYSDVSGTITMTATHATNCPTGSGITFAELEFCPVSGASGCSDLDLEVTTIYDCNVAPVTPVTANDGTFCIGVPNTDPTVTVTAPVSGSVSGTITVTANATDSDGSVEKVEFYLMPEETLIGTNYSGSAGVWSVPLDTTYETDGAHRIKAVATDDDDATAEDTGGEFTIDNGYCLHLEAGLNFVSIPKTIADGPTYAKTLFEIDGTAGEVCWYYNAATKHFISNAQVKPCRGYLVRKNEPMTVCVDFNDAAAAPSQPLSVGWNMIGAVSMDPMPIHNSGIDDTDFASVTGLENPEGTKLFIQMNAYTQGTGWINYPAGPLTEVTPGMGYMIAMTDDVTMYGIP